MLTSVDPWFASEARPLGSDMNSLAANAVQQHCHGEYSREQSQRVTRTYENQTGIKT
jgi:hypothetical protein